MKVLRYITYTLPAVVFCIGWQLAASCSQKFSFLFSSPISVLTIFYKTILTGELLKATIITGFEAFVGLVLGMLIGTILGFTLLYFPKTSKVTNFYLIVLSSVPIFAIAPMMIIWFGIDIEMKIAMSFFSTVFVAITQAYRGGTSIPLNQLEFFLINKASNKEKFQKLIIPNAIDWVIQSLKLNCGLSILGAFIGEFIASDEGLGYLILRASGLYDTPYVLSCILSIMFLTTIFNQLANFIESRRLLIVRKFAL